MPLIIELTPAQQAIFSEIAEELAHNGFEAEPFGARSVAVKIAPAGVDAAQIEHMLNEIFEQFMREDQAINLEAIRTRIAASIACQRCHQGQHASRTKQNGMVARRVGENRSSDDLSARTTGGAALLHAGYPEGV